MVTLNSLSSTVYLMITLAYMLIVFSPINVNCNNNNNNINNNNNNSNNNNSNNDRKNSTLFIEEMVINSLF